MLDKTFCQENCINVYRSTGNIFPTRFQSISTRTPNGWDAGIAGTGGIKKHGVNSVFSFI